MSLSSSGEPFRSKFAIALLVAVLSFLGAIGGSYVSNRLEAAKWDRETHYAYEQALLNKRMDLVERTLRILNKGQSALAVSTTLNSAVEVAYQRRDKNLANKKAPMLDPLFRSDMDKINTTLAQLSDLDAELGVVLSLDRLYFGPKVGKAIDDMNKTYKGGEWWNASRDSTQTLIQTMGREVKGEIRN